MHLLAACGVRIDDLTLSVILPRCYTAGRGASPFQGEMACGFFEQFLVTAQPCSFPKQDKRGWLDKVKVDHLRHFDFAKRDVPGKDFLLALPALVTEMAQVARDDALFVWQKYGSIEKATRPQFAR